MLVCSKQNDPYVNLALEGALFESYAQKEPLLYLWVNRPSVVLGRNQNIWRECRLDAMENDGVLPVRRHTGGGAVYHDMGNLLFSFILPAGYDTDYSYGVVLRAVQSLGIDAQLRGRNDLVAGGRKFSGSAYRVSGRKILHHGTILVDTDMDRLSNYLKPSKTKLQAKGVSSVRARVINLAELLPGLTTQDVLSAQVASFGGGAIADAETIVSPALVNEKANALRDWDFLYGATPEFSAQFETHLSLGEVQLHLNVLHGRVTQAKVYSDALDARLPAQLEAALTGKKMDANTLCTAAHGINPEIANWLSTLTI